MNAPDIFTIDVKDIVHDSFDGIQITLSVEYCERKASIACRLERKGSLRHTEAEVSEFLCGVLRAFGELRDFNEPKTTTEGGV